MGMRRGNCFMPDFANIVRSRLIISALVVLLSCHGYVLAATLASEHENRIVSQIDGSKATLTLSRPEILSVGAEGDISSHIRLPDGTYTLVAEDKDYRFYQAPKPIEYHVHSYGPWGTPAYGVSSVVDNFPGGIYVSKAVISPQQMGIYRGVDPTHKILNWKFGTNFIDNRASKWQWN